MSDSKIRDYREEYLEDQARIGIEVSKNWVWPFAHTLKDLKEIHSQPDFDSETRHYCFKDDEMVGYIWSNIHQDEGFKIKSNKLYNNLASILKNTLNKI